MEIEFERDEGGGRFVARLEGGEEAFVAFEDAGRDRLDYRSTFVPEAHRHQGVGEELVVEALGWARDRGYTVIPTCPFVRWVAERNPSYGDVLEE